MKRRTAIKLGTLAGMGWALAPGSFAQSKQGAPNWQTLVVRYLESLAREDGGYGWSDQERSHLTPTYAVIGAYQVLGLPVPKAERVVEFVRTHHPKELKKLEQRHAIFEFQQIQALTWLGANTSSFREIVEEWTKPWAFLKRYEQDGNPVFQYETSVFLSRQLLGMPMDPLRTELANYVDVRRRANGSFNNTPATDGSDGHVMNTYWGLLANASLGQLDESFSNSITWLQSCQKPDGGFTWQPDASFAAQASVHYTWAAVKGLELLEAEPAQRADCANYLAKLWNEDGGFGDRPGWQSNPIATWRALDALKTLGRFTGLEHTRRPQRCFGRVERRAATGSGRRQPDHHAQGYHSDGCFAWRRHRAQAHHP